MNIIQRILLGLVNISFRIILFFSISVLTFASLYTDQNYIKDLLQRSGAYEKFVPSLIESAKKQKLSDNSEITLSTPDIRQIINESFPPETIKQNIESLISSTYSWLDGDSKELKFTINLEESQNTLSDKLSEFTINRYVLLPVCEEIVIEEIDPLGSNCKSEFIDQEEINQSIRDSYKNNSILLDDPVLTESDVFKDDSMQKYDNFPVYYSLIIPAKVIIFLILLLLGVLIVFLSKNKTVGVRKIGNMLSISAGSLIVFTLVFSYVVPLLTGSLPIIQGSGQGIDSLLNDISIIISRDYALKTIEICIPIVLVGLMLRLFIKVKKTNKYSRVKINSGLENANEKIQKITKPLKSPPPIQSSEVSKSKKPRIKKSPKYRKIPRKEM